MFATTSVFWRLPIEKPYPNWVKWRGGEGRLVPLRSVKGGRAAQREEFMGRHTPG